MGDVFSKNDPPPAPDYAAAARAQGGANLQSTIAQALLNRPEEVTPFGTRRWSTNGEFTIPGAEGNPAVNIPLWTSRIDYTPEGRRMFDQQTRIQQSMGNIAEGGLDRVQNTFGQPLDLSSLGARRTGLNLSGLPNSAAPDFSGAPGRGGMDRFGGELNFSSLPGRTVQPTVAGREAVTQALLDRQAPMREQRAEKLHTDLINAGFSRGTEAYDREIEKLGRIENDERLAAIQAGGAEQSRLFGLESAQRQQAQGEQQALFDSDLRGYGADLSGQQFQSQNRRDAITEALAQADWARQARSQRFGEEVAGFNAEQSARGAGLNELTAMRQLPLQELNAFRTGAQPVLPNFQNFSPVNMPQPAPLYQATRDQFQGQLDNYNAQQAGTNSMLSGLFGLGSAWLGAGGFGGGALGAV